MGDMTDYLTLTRRPILQVGTWNASTGRESITDEDLASIVSAYAAGVLDPAVLKIGHSDPRFNAYLEDGSPAYGQVTNLVADGGVLYGDYEHMPRELAESLDSAYPRSSVELARNVVLRDQEGNVTHEFPVVLTANALLGATPPAVKGLSQKAALSEDQVDYTTTIITAQFSLPGAHTAKSLGDHLMALVQSRHSSETTWAYLEDFTDAEVIFAVEGYSDTAYYRQAFSVPESGKTPELSGDPIRVVKETKWVEESADDTPPVPQQEDNFTHALSEAPPTPAPETDPEGDTPMATVDKDQAAALRDKYNLASNAPYEDILAAVLADEQAAPAVTRPQDVRPGTDETDNQERTDAQEQETADNPNFSAAPEAPAAEQAPATPAAAAPRNDEVTVSRSAFSQFQAEFAAMQKREKDRTEAEDKTRRDGLVSSWFSAGKIGPDEREGIREDLDVNEELTVRNVGRRAALFSTQEAGHAYADETHFSQGTASTKEATILAADDALFGFTS